MTDVTVTGTRLLRRCPTIGVLYGWQVFGGAMDAYLESLVMCLTAAARDKEVNLLTAVAVGSRARDATPAWPSVGPNRIFAPVGPWNTDGLIVINPLPADEILEDVRRIQGVGHPVVYLSRGPDGPCVVPDNRGGIELALTHLAAHGHRRIAFLSCEHGDGPERRSAYEETVRRLGLVVDPALIVDAAHERFAGGRAIDQLVEFGVPFTAVLTSNGDSGRGATGRLLDLGLAVPESVAVVAFDDFLDALATEPALTSIHFPVDLVAEAAIDTLLDQINGGVVPPKTITVPTSLVERESCGCTPTYSGDTSERKRRAIAKRVIEHREVASAVGTFASELLAATQLDMRELGRILGETMTEVGIARPLLGIYEPVGDDPVASSIIEPGDGLERARFATRTFPPTALAPREPFRMMVMPLRLHDEFGYIALASDDLASCVAIAHQSEAAFESARNIMVRERAEASLADTEERLRQAQRMEAIGQLAGGIAHDFNNLLTPIVGCASLIVTSAGDDEKLRRNAELIATAADRAALLTRQLLAFSRRQIMQPTVLDINDVLRDMHALLVHVLGSDLDLVLRLDEDAGHIEVDRSQLDQVILNLALNGRDAMPGGGTLTLETATVRLSEEEPYAATLPAGSYTTLTVRDSGTGMSEDVRAHAFEPFFTTKKGGDNTGLGLATVHGIVKQSGGEIHLETVSGGGSTFTVYLPHVVAPAQSVVADLARRDDSTPRATRTVMVVDDEEIVRRFIRQTLELHSYNVLEAGNGLEAIELWRLRPGEIDVVLTDMVMPAMTGMELIDRLDEEGVPPAIVCMSGYAENSILERHTLSSALAYLPKPFTSNDLLMKIAGVLPEHD